ncbi:hypothetical protein ROLI_035190 [Roseobacter fucihabitans]|uniref:Uncharacterized protein n=1 Tax=Roseobacter fucihabitans TaxID=1537242 RepID=A0ABZ2BWG7_9RHOB|nr:hypothetical protein [Roseobacter litoralis]
MVYASDREVSGQTRIYQGIFSTVVTVAVGNIPTSGFLIGQAAFDPSPAAQAICRTASFLRAPTGAQFLVFSGCLLMS